MHYLGSKVSYILLFVPSALFLVAGLGFICDAFIGSKAHENAVISIVGCLFILFAFLYSKLNLISYDKNGIYIKSVFYKKHYKLENFLLIKPANKNIPLLINIYKIVFIDGRSFYFAISPSRDFSMLDPVSKANQMAQKLNTFVQDNKI
ncbi:hypothetical protein [Xanthocytophaga agilis]|uniref:Uncharacterized protein n=1 Tax=Xanthocytophaga agilis TaxID=3048010 RepID=A0AAE3UJC5_9BACT|nr:hypothetical protein [Xanthocytophaga agilis]MDJ1505727.1 hypothetical protein [Xanthocytophaga agilis]